MTIQHREAFLNHIAAKLGRPRRVEGVKRPNWNVRPQLKVFNELTQDELVDVLEKQCEAIHTTLNEQIKTD